MTDTPRQLGWPLLIVLAVVVVGGATDLWFDGPEAWWTFHAAIEVSLVCVSAAFLVYFWRAWRDSLREASMARSALAQSERSLSERNAERDQWRASAEQALAGLGQAINVQFDLWKLTPSEREVAVLLLKGLGHKQIAAQTSRSERTVRQHAVTVYAKSGLGGRAELAAFFLQDLALPNQPT
jgi:DNA-binding CsgD family transcriptional regulator